MTAKQSNMCWLKQQANAERRRSGHANAATIIGPGSPRATACREELKPQLAPRQHVIVKGTTLLEVNHTAF